MPPEGLRGSQDLLDLYRSARTAPFWNQDRFSLLGNSWRLGSGDETDGDTIFHFPPADLLNQSYGNEAPRRIRQLEAELALRSTNPAVVSDDEVYFGALLRSASGEQSAGIQIQQVGPSVISLALVRDGQADFISQRSVNNVITRLRLDRDPQSGAVSAFFNDSPIGDPIDFVAPDEEIVPVIFVKDGGVTIGVSAWSVTLD